MQRRMVVSYQHFGTTIGPIFNGPVALLLGHSGCPKTSVRKYSSTLWKIPQERWAHYTMVEACNHAWHMAR